MPARTLSAPAIRFRRCSIGPCGQPILEDFSWEASPGETWVITGANGSGKSALVAALAGQLPVRPEPEGRLELPQADRVALVSSETLSRLFLEERHNDESDFIDGGVDDGTRAIDFLRRGLTADGSADPVTEREGLLGDLVTGLGIDGVLARGIKYLSTGELRKVALGRHLLQCPDWLVLDEIRDGLDADARHWLGGHLERLILAGRPCLILVSDRYEALPHGVDHVLHLEANRVVFAGTRVEYETTWLPSHASDAGNEPGSREAGCERLAGLVTAGLAAGPAGIASSAAVPEVLVELRDVTVAWSGRAVIDRLSWTLVRGEHTLVCGPNGCGKTTLLNLITGDNPQVYANDVTVLGIKRGSGESVWDIKRQIGMVSYQLHVEYLYHCDSTVEEAIISGFHDSIGLYETAGDFERLTARAWLAELGLADKAGWAFTRLSYGEQRAALIARAMVKQPHLLVLDEPCHGLDAGHRHHALAIADFIGRNTATTILYVTHDPTEYLPCLRRVLEFGPDRRWREGPLVTSFPPKGR